MFSPLLPNFLSSSIIPYYSKNDKFCCVAKTFFFWIKKEEKILFFELLYSSFTGAPTGQTLAHVPHSIHADASILYLSPSFAIHCTGQAAAHAPQAIQVSDILYAILLHHLSTLFHLSFLILFDLVFLVSLTLSILLNFPLPLCLPFCLLHFSGFLRLWHHTF